jgi:hypothetical protein
MEEKTVISEQFDRQNHSPFTIYYLLLTIYY